jgi:hypothetical protein
MPETNNNLNDLHHGCEEEFAWSASFNVPSMIETALRALDR